MTTEVNRSDSEVIRSHITNRRDKSLVFIDAVGFRQWYVLEQAAMCHHVMDGVLVFCVLEF